MRLFVITAHRLRLIGLLLLTAAGTSLLLSFPAAAQNGVRRGLSLCGQILIPSLFPFLVLIGFLIRSGSLHALARLVEMPMRRVFGFSGCAAPTMLLSLLGGYPTGAAAITGLLEHGDITVDEGQRLLRCAVNAGPAFVIGGVGVGMLASPQAGLLLLAAHWLASLTVCLCERTAAPPHPPSRSVAQPLGQAITDSLHSAAESLISMCSFVLLACTALSLFDALGGASYARSLWRCVLSGLLEVSTGCLEASRMGALSPFLLGAMLGFGGLAVHGQIAAVTARFSLLDARFFRTRLLHALLGGTLTHLLFQWFPPPSVALAASAALSSVNNSNAFVGTTALFTMMLLCVLFLMTLPKSRTERATLSEITQ